MKAKRSENNESTAGRVRLSQPEAYNLFGNMNFVLTGAKKEVSKKGGSYWTGSYDFEYLDKETGERKSFSKRINSGVELPQEWVGKKLFVKVKVSKRYDKVRKKVFQNYFIVEAELAQRPA